MKKKHIARIVFTILCLSFLLLITHAVAVGEGFTFLGALWRMTALAVGGIVFIIGLVWSLNNIE